MYKLKCKCNKVPFAEDDVGVSVTAAVRLAARMDGEPNPDVSGMVIHMDAGIYGPYSLALKTVRDGRPTAACWGCHF